MQLYRTPKYVTEEVFSGTFLQKKKKGGKEKEKKGKWKKKKSEDYITVNLEPFEYICN